jgi:hypothetical protein
MESIKCCFVIGLSVARVLATVCSFSLAFVIGFYSKCSGADSMNTVRARLNEMLEIRRPEEASRTFLPGLVAL